MHKCNYGLKVHVILTCGQRPKLLKYTLLSALKGQLSINCPPAGGRRLIVLILTQSGALG